ncbi:MAG: hypothetical protein VX835_02715 [Pseudomonadota bacterium]|nr:hypothetical protein [Pseudomonadota bacterium]
MTNRLTFKLCLISLLSAVHAFSWQVTDTSPEHPNKVIYSGFKETDSPSLSYNMTSSFITNWPTWLTMHLPGYFMESNSNISPGLKVQGASQNSYLAKPNAWAFFINGMAWQSPISHAAQPWLSSEFSWVSVSHIDSNTFFPNPSGSLWVDAHRGNTSYEKTLSFSYDGNGTQYYDLWLTQEHNPMGFSAWLKHDIAKGQRENTDGHDSNILLQFTSQTPKHTDHWLFQWYDSHANYNQTIPLELFLVAPDTFYVAPNFIDQKAYHGQWQRQALITDDKIYHVSVDAKTQRQDGHFTHPLNLGTGCSDFTSSQLCLSENALMTDANATINPSDIGNPRSYAMDSNTSHDSQSIRINQNIEVDKKNQRFFWGLNTLFVDSDILENHYLANLNSRRNAIDVKNNGELVKLGGLKSTTSSESVLASFSPVNATQKETDFDLYGANRFIISPVTSINIKGAWHNTFYDTKDHRENGTFAGASVSDNTHYHKLNPSIGITHQLGQKDYFYSQLYQSNMVPTPQQLACSDASNPCYWPSGFFKAGNLSQTIDRGLRMGYKYSDWYVTNGFSWAIVGAWQRHKNDIIFVPTDWMQGYVRNVDRTERLSSNLDAHWMHDKWRLDGNYQYQHAYYASHFDVAKAYASGIQQVNSGDPMPGLPAQQLRLNLGYQWAPSIRFALDWLASSDTEYYGNFTGDKSSQESNQWQLTDVPGYGIFSASALWRPSYQLTMQFNVSNLFDKQYFTSGTYGSAPDSAFVPMSELGDTGTGTIQGIDDPRFVMPGESRLWTLLIKFTF